MHKIKKHAHKKTKQNENGIQPLQICAGGKKKKKKRLGIHFNSLIQ